jgi:hypothetical protein
MLTPVTASLNEAANGKFLYGVLIVGKTTDAFAAKVNTVGGR